MKYFLTLFLLLGITFSAKAGTFSVKNFPKLDGQVFMTRENFEAGTRQIEETPLSNKKLSYKMRLAPSWTKLQTKTDNVENDVSKQILGNIVEYLGPPMLDLRSSFRIRANDLLYDITAKDWFLSYIFGSGYNLEGIDVISDKKVQAQYVMVSDGNQYRVRAVVEISGPRVILAEYVVPLDFWEREKDMAKRAMAGFTLTDPDPAPIEIQQSFSFVDIAQFRYPSSWILNAPPITSIERMSATLTNLKGNPQQIELRRTADNNVLMDGRINISIVAKTPDVTIEKEIADLKAQMLEKKLVLGDLIERVDGWDHHAGITFSRVEAYKINNPEARLANYEQWVGIFETPGRYYFVRLLTVGRQNDFLTWARNVQAYKTVISTLSPVTN